MTRDQVKNLGDIPGIGPVMEKNLLALGIREPSDLIGNDPYRMYQELCSLTRKRHDPCVIDVFLSAVSYMEGNPARKWWKFTETRKKHYGS